MSRFGILAAVRKSGEEGLKNTLSLQSISDVAFAGKINQRKQLM